MNQVYVDSGTEKHRKFINLSSSCLTDIQKKALLGLHAFTGNDFVSSFFRKGKLISWNIIKKNNNHLTTLCQIGCATQIPDILMIALENFVFRVYGDKRNTSEKDARATIFWKKFNRTNTAIDLSLLPPCRRSLVKHAKRENYTVII